MNRTPLRASLPVIALLVLDLIACSGGILPVAQNSGDAGPDSGDPSSNGTGGGGGAGGGGNGTGSGKIPPPDGGPGCNASQPINCNGCPAVCVGDQWVCGPCSPDGGSTECNPPCAPNEVCVRDQILGGPFMPVDGAGACPPGRHPVNGQCVQDPTFACVPSPFTACNGTSTDCSCAAVANVCISQQTCPFSCTSASLVQIDCQCDVP